MDGAEIFVVFEARLRSGIEKIQRRRRNEEDGQKIKPDDGLFLSDCLTQHSALSTQDFSPTTDNRRPITVRSVDVFNLAVEWAGDDVRRVRVICNTMFTPIRLEVRLVRLEVEASRILDTAGP